MKRQMDMRNARHVVIGCTLQHCVVRGKDDVVAVPEIAGEQRSPRRPTHQPRGLAARHCPCRIWRAFSVIAKSCQPGAGVRGSDRHNRVHTMRGIELTQPGANGQAAHAVRDHDRCQRGGFLQPPYRGINCRDVAIDRTEHRFQIDGDIRRPGPPESLHPGIPQTPVADEAMNEKDAALVVRAPPVRLATLANETAGAIRRRAVRSRPRPTTPCTMLALRVAGLQDRDQHGATR